MRLFFHSLFQIAMKLNGYVDMFLSLSLSLSLSNNYFFLLFILSLPHSIPSILSFSFLSFLLFLSLLKGNEE
jgi:hypothetical protein